MGNYEQLKQAVSNVIKPNGNQEITGSILQNALSTIISTVGYNATFAGIATPETNPGTPDQNVFYIASENGTYSNFNGITLSDEVSILSNKNGSWKKDNTGLATQQQFSELDVATTRFYAQGSFRFVMKEYLSIDVITRGVGSSYNQMGYVFVNGRTVYIRNSATSNEEVNYNIPKFSYLYGNLSTGLLEISDVNNKSNCIPLIYNNGGGKLESLQGALKYLIDNEKIAELNLLGLEFYLQGSLTYAINNTLDLELTIKGITENGQCGYYYNNKGVAVYIKNQNSIKEQTYMLKLNGTTFLYANITTGFLEVSEEINKKNCIMLLCYFKNKVYGKLSDVLNAIDIGNLKYDLDVSKSIIQLHNPLDVKVSKNGYNLNVSLVALANLNIGWVYIDGVFTYFKGNNKDENVYVVPNNNFLYLNLSSHTIVVSTDSNMGNAVLLLDNSHGRYSKGELVNFIQNNRLTTIEEKSNSSVDYDKVVRSVNRMGYGSPVESLVGLKRAYNLGWRIMRYNLEFTSDNIPVAFHDSYLNQNYKHVRMADGSEIPDPTVESNRVYISETAYNVLRNNYDIGISSGEQYRGMKIPSWEEVLELGKYLGIEIYIEIKQMTEMQAPIIVNLVKMFGMWKRVTWIGYPQNTLKYIADITKNARLATMSSSVDDDAINAIAALSTAENGHKCGYFGWDTTVLTEQAVNKMIEKNIFYEIGTINTEQGIKNYFNKGNAYKYCTGVESDSLIAGKVLLESVVE